MFEIPYLRRFSRHLLASPQPLPRCPEESVALAALGIGDGHLEVVAHVEAINVASVRGDTVLGR